MQLGLRPLSIATLTLTWVVLATGITEGRGLLISESLGIADEAVRVKAKPVVNQDQLAGKWKQFKGDLKQKWAEFTDDDLLAIEGRVDQLEGKIQERYGDRREEVKRWIDDWFDAQRTQKEVPPSS